MKHYANNPKWLLWFAPFKALSVSTAYLAPFFLEKGLNQTEIFLLQSVFSLAVLVWELPSGYVADKWGRARCIQLSAPIAAVAMIAYGLSSSFWQLALCELALALANGLISGADSALLFDSLYKPGQSAEEHQAAAEKMQKRINAIGFAAPVVGLPLATLLASQVSLGATFIADGVLTAVGMLFVLRLAEAPRLTHPQEEVESAWRGLLHMLGKAEVRWLLVLNVSLSTATYMSAWLATPVYISLGVPVAAFAGLMAVRNLWKAMWSHWFHPTRHIGRYMATYTLLAALGFVGMASGSWWLVWLVLGHEVVHAMQGPAIISRLNGSMHSQHRATLNSAVNLLQRLSFTVVGPLVGLAVDFGGLRTGAWATGALCAGAAAFALVRLHRYRTFSDKR